MADSVSKQEKKIPTRREGSLSGSWLFYFPFKPELIILEYEIDEAKIRYVMIMFIFRAKLVEEKENIKSDG